MHMSSNLDAARLADLARDPNSHGDAATVAHAALRAAQAQRATLNTAGQAIDAAMRPCFDIATGTYPGLSGDLRRPYDADYGSYTGHGMDPRSDVTDDGCTSLQPLGDARVMVSYSWDSNNSLSIDGATIGAEFVSVDNFSNHVRGQWEKAIKAEEAKDAEIARWGE